MFLGETDAFTCGYNMSPEISVHHVSTIHLYVANSFLYSIVIRSKNTVLCEHRTQHKLWMCTVITFPQLFHSQSDLWSLGITALEMAEGAPRELEIHLHTHTHSLE